MVRKFLTINLPLACIITPLLASEVNVNANFRHPAPLEMATWLPDTLPDARIRYSPESPVQFGDLRLPAKDAPPAGHPVIIFIHGGAWMADWTKEYSTPFVEALTRAGFATWDLEFRRLGNEGGGFPGTFLDIAAGADHLQSLDERFPLDLSRVVAMGHSSGGHLALWLAGRRNLPPSSTFYSADALPLAGVVSLAGVNDLERSLTLGDRTDVLDLLGVDSSDDAESRFELTNPARLLPFGIPQVLIVGTGDAEWRIAMTREFAAAARAAGDSIELIEPRGADHFDVVDPEGPALELAVSRTMDLLQR